MEADEGTTPGSDAPASYLVLSEGTPALASGGEQIGTVKRVLGDPALDIFDGLVINTERGDRFVGASDVGEIHERHVELKLSAEQAAKLPEPEGAAPIYEDDPSSLERGSAVGRLWSKLSGRSLWRRR